MDRHQLKILEDTIVNEVRQVINKQFSLLEANIIVNQYNVLLESLTRPGVKQAYVEFPDMEMNDGFMYRVRYTSYIVNSARITQETLEDNTFLGIVTHTVTAMCDTCIGQFTSNASIYPDYIFEVRSPLSVDLFTDPYTYDLTLRLAIRGRYFPKESTYKTSSELIELLSKAPKLLSYHMDNNE